MPGRAGFWLHRHLASVGAENEVVGFGAASRALDWQAQIGLRDGIGRAYGEFLQEQAGKP